MSHDHARPSGRPGRAMPAWKHDGVRVIPADRLDANTAQTPGMNRAAAINFARVGAQKLWAGTVTIHANAKTGAHHHGQLESVIYVVRGRARMRWGEQLEFTAEAGPGDFIYVPPYVPHQEINASADRGARMRAVPQRRRGGRGQPRHRTGREARVGAVGRPDASARRRCERAVRRDEKLRRKTQPRKRRHPDTGHGLCCVQVFETGGVHGFPQSRPGSVPRVPAAGRQPAQRVPDA